MGGESGGGIEQVNRLTSEQQSALQRLLGEGTFGGLEQGLEGFNTEAATSAFEQGPAAQARKQFSEQTIPGLQERFTAMGGGRSSALPRMATAAGAGLESGLSGQLAQLLFSGEEAQKNRQIQAALQALGLGMGTSAFDSMVKPGQAGPGGAIGSLAGAGLGAFMGGPVGASIGGGIGGSIGSMF